jgi:hypothetical protein
LTLTTHRDIEGSKFYYFLISPIIKRMKRLSIRSAQQQKRELLNLILCCSWFNGRLSYCLLAAGKADPEEEMLMSEEGKESANEIMT